MKLSSWLPRLAKVYVFIPLGNNWKDMPPTFVNLRIQPTLTSWKFSYGVCAHTILVNTFHSIPVPLVILELYPVLGVKESLLFIRICI